MFPAYLLTKNKIWQLYLIGLKGLFELKPKHIYRSYKELIIVICPLIYAKYLLTKYKPEFYQLEKPGIFPTWIYKSRLDHYKYWELSRIARGKPATFNYYDYDSTSDFMFYTSDTGVQLSEKNNFHLEKIENANNPLFEEIIKKFKSTHSQESLRTGNMLIAYEQNRTNYLSLMNYLCYKPITVSDVLRAIYQNTMVYFKLTNFYRYDHFVQKSDFFYSLEKLKLGMNIYDKHKEDKVEEYARIFDRVYELGTKRTNKQTSN